MNQGIGLPRASRRRGRMRGQLMAVVAAALLPAHAGGAAADHGGQPIGSFSTCDRPVQPPRCSSVGNDLMHFVYFDASFTPELASSLADTMREDFNPSDLNLVLQSRVTPLTDVIAFSQDYGENGAAGWTYCPPDSPQGINSRGHRWCQKQELHINLNAGLAVFTADDGSRDHITCHELGHTIGLRHWGNPPDTAGPTAATCMTGDTPDGHTTLHQIDYDHINAYPYDSALGGAGKRPDPEPAAEAAVADAESVIWPWAPVEAIEMESYGSLAEMTAAADAVVRGSVVSVAMGRTFGSSSHPFHYATVAVKVDELIRGAVGDLHAGALMLEIPLFGGAASLPALEASVVGADAIYFLRGKEDAGFHRLVTLRALVLNAGGLAAVAPGPGDFLDALAGATFDEALARVRAAEG